MLEDRNSTRADLQGSGYDKTAPIELKVPCVKQEGQDVSRCMGNFGEQLMKPNEP